MTGGDDHMGAHDHEAHDRTGPGHNGHNGHNGHGALDGAADPDDLDVVLDRLLAGTAAPGGTAWSGGVALLVHAAQAPAGADELTGEDAIVGRMREVLTAPPADDAVPPARAGAPSPLGVVDLAERRARRSDDEPYVPAHAAVRREPRSSRVARGAGRVVAAKAAAAVTAGVLGIAAAAATTGIVVTMVVPAVSDLARKPEPVTATTESGPELPGTTTGGGSDRPVDRPDQAVSCPGEDACAKGATAPDSTLDTSTTVPPASSTTAGEPTTTATDQTTSTSGPETTSTTTASTTSGTTGTTVAEGPGSPGSGRGQGRPTSPGHGQPSDRS